MIKVVHSVEDMAKAIEGGICYISGPISGVANYREIFAEAESMLLEAGMIAINPAYMPEGLPYDDYFPTCYAQIGISNALCFLPGYYKSTSAAREAKRAQWSKKEYWCFTTEQYCLYCDLADCCEEEKGIPETEKETRERLAENINTIKDSIQISGELLEGWIRDVNPLKTEIQKQNDKVRRVLRSYLYCQQLIDAACDEITTLDSRRKRITVQYREVHGGSGAGYPEQVIENINSLEEEIILETKQLDGIRRWVKSWIDSLEDLRERSVLTLCYINGMGLEAVAEELNYNYDYVRRLHGRAVNKLREIIKDATTKKKIKKSQKVTTECGIMILPEIGKDKDSQDVPPKT